MENTDMTWRKSSYSGGANGNCVETASGAGVVLVRDTTDRDGGTLVIERGVWMSFINTIK